MFALFLFLIFVGMIALFLIGLAFLSLWGFLRLWEWGEKHPVILGKVEIPMDKLFTDGNHLADRETETDYKYMFHCPYCDGYFSDKREFCPACGAVISSVEDTKQLVSVQIMREHYEKDEANHDFDDLLEAVGVRRIR